MAHLPSDEACSELRVEGLRFVGFSVELTFPGLGG